MNRAPWDDAPNGLWIASYLTGPGGVRHLHDNTHGGGFLVPVCSHHSERWRVVSGHLYDETRPCSSCMARVGFRLSYFADLLRQQGYAPEHIITTTTTKDPTT